MSNHLFSKFSFHLQRRVHNIQARNIISFCYKRILPKTKLSEGINTLQFYNTKEEIDRFIQALKRVVLMLR